MKKTTVFLSVILGLVIVIATIISMYSNATYMVFKNLTAYKIKMDESTKWDGGSTYAKTYYASDSQAQYLDLYVPDAESESLPKLFVLIHGGGFITNDSQSRQAQLMYRYFRDHGYACASVNYRLAQEEPFPGALSDVKAAIRFLRSHADEYGYDAEKIAVWGESAGGYLAVAAAVTNDDEFMDVTYIDQAEKESKNGKVSAKVSVCVDYYGAVELGKKNEDWKTLKVPQFIIDIANSWLHTQTLEGYEDVESFWLRKDTGTMTDEDIKAFDIYHYASENLDSGSNIKFWLSHGDCDITVPIMQTERFYNYITELIGQENVEYTVISGAGHAGDIMYTDEELSRIKNYLDENL
ncbi:MAG: alpha/beta hydrolase [Butyrivibrio sp.]|uniref:alpha/beta hydrolase n=1 Tax=Butyrivibrio sp. TaxID=28121 RepID=UPI001B0D5C40|nr:alpha/beta hydrolase [Butyrivibrio sp.]MBO6239253.1 alpha/beta hydrolase [Butyrivibrio sp.]